MAVMTQNRLSFGVSLPEIIWLLFVAIPIPTSSALLHKTLSRDLLWLNRTALFVLSILTSLHIDEVVADVPRKMKSTWVLDLQIPH